jgi:glutamate--cysteine ligase
MPDRQDAHAGGQELRIPIEQRLQRLGDAGGLDALRDGVLLGLEKESLRVAPDGVIAFTPHPPALGSALTHPWITTDYSEALTELVTPPFGRGAAVLAFLEDLHVAVYRAIGHERLWASSMPCILLGEENIPIAEYGTSNAGRMKHIYRVGLGYRYGRIMQVISGVHFNSSFGDAFWAALQHAAGDTGPPRAFRDEGYMGQIRNLQRYGWLVPYLFGASPAVCKTFLDGRPTAMAELDSGTYYEPYGTSLRMGNIGYQNRREEGVGVKACYDSLGAYVASLTHAIRTPALLWEDIGVVVDGEYRQLNANILQIENEYYSTVRPKQVLERLEKPTMALRNRGIRYVELRSPDVNVFEPLGVDEAELHFLEAFALHCLLLDSPKIRLQERWEIDRNLEKAAHRGRDPGLRLLRSGQAIALRDWATAVLDEMAPVCEVLDRVRGAGYTQSLAAQRAKVADSELTPSARVLRELRERGESFHQLARRYTEGHRAHFLSKTLSPVRQAELGREAAASIERQAAIEAADDVDFETFLASYFAQR